MGRWAKDWDCCRECGTTEIPHHAKGLCQLCYFKDWRRKHPGYQAAIAKQWRARNPNWRQEWERRGRRRRSWVGRWDEWLKQERKRNSHGPRQKRWSAKNRDKCREYSRRYRARKVGATILPVNEAAIYARDGYRCVYCGAQEDLTLDHIVPLSKGGTHSEDNLVVACRSCNASKGNRSLLEWLLSRL